MNYPKKFADSLGREWSVDLHVANIDNIEEYAGVPFDSLIPKEGATKDSDLAPWHEFLSDDLRIFDVFYALVVDQANAAKLDKKAVKKGFATDAATDAMAGAVLQAIIDFFQRRNPARAGMLRKWVQARMKLMARAETEIAKIDIDRIAESARVPTGAEVTQAVIDQLSKSATATPATSAST